MIFLGQKSGELNDPGQLRKLEIRNWPRLIELQCINNYYEVKMTGSDIYNRFYGSLEYLQNMINLETLAITNQNQ